MNLSPQGSLGRDFSRPANIPGLRSDPFEPDGDDEQRAAYVRYLWHSQDDLLRQRDRQVEENLRMLLGQQWIVWSDLQKKYVDLTTILPDDERRWRQLPVINSLVRWFMYTHARLTENPPVLTAQPGPDRIDAQLAELFDSIFKYWWSETGMLEVLDRLMGWMTTAGAASLKSRIDPMKGAPIQMVGRGSLELIDAETESPILGTDGLPIRRDFEGVPFDENGQPNARALWDGEAATMDPGDPATFLEGALTVDVLSCLERRGTWGPTPWHEKDWHIQRSFLTPEQAYDSFGVEIEPDVTGQMAEDVSLLQGLLFGSGLYGASERSTRAQLVQVENTGAFVSVYEFWRKPWRDQPGTKEDPGGRLTIVAGGKVARDATRPLRFKYTSPIRNFDFLQLPGRPSGTSPQEMFNGPSRTRNRFFGQLFQHASKVANPATILDSSQIKAEDWSNAPGIVVSANRLLSDGRPAVEYTHPPQLGKEVGESIDRLTNEIALMGTLEGAEGTPPTKDSSGELVKELRWNSDRPIASPLRRATVALSRMAEDWLVMLPVIWDEERVIQVNGDDNISRTITVYPDLLSEGKINVIPELESMLPEGRGERQARAEKMLAMGVWGPPDSPQAINMYLDQARFPHMSRMARPGGEDRTTAEQFVGQLLQGTPAMQLPIYPWYDTGMFLWVVERFMKSPEYLKQEVEIQQEFVTFWTLLQEAEIRRAQLQAQQAAAVQGTELASQMEVAQQIDPGMGAEEPPPSPEQVA